MTEPFTVVAVSVKQLEAIQFGDFSAYIKGASGDPTYRE